MSMDADKSERRKQAIEAAAEAINDIIYRLSDSLELLQEDGVDPVRARTAHIMTELMPRVILSQVSCWGVGDLYQDAIILATQGLAMERAEWEDGDSIPIGLGCRWVWPEEVS